MLGVLTCKKSPQQIAVFQVPKREPRKDSLTRNAKTKVSKYLFAGVKKSGRKTYHVDQELPERLQNNKKTWKKKMQISGVLIILRHS